MEGLMMQSFVDMNITLAELLYCTIQCQLYNPRFIEFIRIIIKDK